MGTVVGGFIGGLAGGVAAGAAGGCAGKMAMDYLVEDDVKVMMSFASDVMTELADEYLLTQEEFDQAIEKVSAFFATDFLREMYGCDSAVARSLLVTRKCEPDFRRSVAERATVAAPSAETVEAALNAVVVEIEKEEEQEEQQEQQELEQVEGLEPEASAPVKSAFARCVPGSR